MFLAAYLSMDIVSMIFAYYMKYYVLEPGALSMVLGVLLIVEILFIPFYAFIARKKSKTFAFIIGAIIWAFGSILIFMLPQSAPLYLVIILAALIGSGVSAAAVIPHTLFGDVTDVGELAYSERREGSFSGIITFARKFASGIAVAFVTFLLGVTGYLNPEIILENGVEKSVERIQPESVLLTIRIIISFVPLVLMALGIWAAVKYPLNPENHRKMIDYLTAERKGEKLQGMTSEEIEKLKEELI
jgi:oligogalacturonide transporter